MSPLSTGGGGDGGGGDGDGGGGDGGGGLDGGGLPGGGFGEGFVSSSGNQIRQFQVESEYPAHDSLSSHFFLHVGSSAPW